MDKNWGWYRRDLLRPNYMVSWHTSCNPHTQVMGQHVRPPTLSSLLLRSLLDRRLTVLVNPTFPSASFWIGKSKSD